MIEFVRSRHIDATPDRIWPYVADITAWPRWFTEAERGEVVSGEAAGRRQRMYRPRAGQGDRDRLGGDGVGAADAAPLAP
jgi:uncharacterized protein YndB with AHSA1/START domain